jgi:hypothetical protein
MDRDPTASAQPSRKLALAICAAIVFGTLCFLAGRLSVRPGIPDSEPALTDHSDHSPPPVVFDPGIQIDSVVAEKSSGWDGKKWRQLVSEPGTTERNTTMAAMLEKLATTDPSRAMAQAQAEKNLVLRDSLVHAVLRGWARVEPQAAANWALTLPQECDRSAAITTVFDSAVAARPEEAVRVAKLIVQQEPGGAMGYGSTLIDALCEGGHFQTAVQFATDGDGGDRSRWLAEAFSKWATLQPEQAAAAAAIVTDPETRNEALHGVVGGWAEADPAALTQFLAQMPAGGDRASMLSQALQKWVTIDAESASTWLNDAKLGSDLDAGIAAVASTDFLEPKVGITWAESITDEQLRSESLRKVLENWVRSDFPAAKQYFDTTTALQPGDRQRITELIAVFTGEGLAQSATAKDEQPAK